MPPSRAMADQCLARVPPWLQHEHGSQRGYSRIFASPVFPTLIFLLLACSGFVLTEPAPYDVLALAVIATFLICGVPIAAGIVPLLLLTFAIIASSFPAATQASEPSQAFLYVTVTGFLAITAIFFSVVTAMDPIRWVRLIMWGYVIAATLTAIIAIGGYFGALPGSDRFLLYGRAKGTFNDPNVMGPFLIPPALFLLSRILRESPWKRMMEMALMSIILSAIFLSFSRGAWGHTVFSGGIMIFMLFITARTQETRARIVLLTGIGIFVVCVMLVWLASLEDVRGLLLERAHLTQTYDVEAGGRFSRYGVGFMLAAQSPLGLGPLEFGKIFGEDPHNVYLKMFSGYGWIAGIAYLILVLTTLASGAKHCMLRTPWQVEFQILYACFLGVVLLGLIIDTERWRHYWLVIGMLWGMMAASTSRQPGMENAHLKVSRSL